MDTNLFQELFRSESHLKITKLSIKTFGLEMAVFLADLADKDHYFAHTNNDYTGWFYSTKEYRSADLGISVHVLQRCMNEAVKNNYVETVTKGIPSKQWIRLNYPLIHDELVANAINSSRPISTNPSRPIQQYPSRPIQQYPNKEDYNKEDYNKEKKTLCAQPSFESFDDDSNNTPPPVVQQKRTTRIKRPITPPPPVEPEPDIYHQIAIQLKRCVARHWPKDVVDAARVHSWEKHIQAIFKKWRGTPANLLEMLKLYYAHYDKTNRYHCIIRSGESLKEKITSLESFVDNQIPKLNSSLRPTEAQAQSTKFKDTACRTVNL